MDKNINKNKNSLVEIFTDGACSGNPGPGGWAALLRYGEYEKEIWGKETHTTNNRMELIAAIKALEALKKPCKVRLVTDSEYVKNGITKWIKNWKLRDWKTSEKKPVKNVDLWKSLDELTNKHEVEWKWVKGHSNHKENERVDSLARKALRT